MDARSIMQRDILNRSRYNELGGFEEEYRLFKIWRAKQDEQEAAYRKSKELKKNNPIDIVV